MPKTEMLKKALRALRAALHAENKRLTDSELRSALDRAQEHGYVKHARSVRNNTLKHARSVRNNTLKHARSVRNNTLEHARSVRNNTHFSRREMLKLSLQAGAALPLASLLAHEALAAKAVRAIKRHTSGATDPIIIVGAGVAGLVAAYRLQKAGMSVELYEGNARLGGRVFTKDRFNADGNEVGVFSPNRRNSAFH